MKQIAEQIYAGVLGKLIGVYLGRPVEGWTYDAIEKRFGDILYYQNAASGAPLIVPDDDISGTFAFIRSLEDNQYAPDLCAEQIGQTWLNYIIENQTILWWGGLSRSTEHTAFLRLKAGIPAPQSGSTALNGRSMAEQIGAEIFIDSWALVHPNDPERAVFRVRRHEPCAPLFEPHALDCEFTVDVADGNAAVVGVDRPVDDEQVAVADAVAGHAVARHTHEEGRRGVVDQLAVQVERSVEEVVGRRGEARPDGAARHGKLLPRGEVGSVEGQGLVSLFVHLLFCITFVFFIFSLSAALLRFFALCRVLSPLFRAFADSASSFAPFGRLLSTFSDAFSAARGAFSCLFAGRAKAAPQRRRGAGPD